MYYCYFLVTLGIPAYPALSVLLFVLLFSHETMISRLAQRLPKPSTPPTRIVPPKPQIAKRPSLTLVQGGHSQEKEAPKFTGKPHEVLCVPEDAGTKTINIAYRHWIKQFHPDKNATASAQVHARQLHEARQKLLSRRKMRMCA
jgi:hypothetical protein